jgi:PD-(D/E)XK nuclease superfamily protein
MTQEELEAAYAWEAEDAVPGRPEMTELRRRLRLQQSRWREAHGHPAGTQPIVPKPNKPSRPVGSRLPLDYARETGANFVTDAARAAARERLAVVEPNQSLDHQRIWADLLWSPSLAFNLFADDAAQRALAPSVDAVRFAHSPGWLDPAYLGSLRSFDALLVLDDGGAVAVDVKYHERAKAEQPKPENLRRYREVAERSGAFAPGAIDTLSGRSELAVLWLEHLLLHSMLQHESGRWTHGRYVVVHPAGNADVAGLCERYRALLDDDSTFRSLTLESLPLSKPVRERYLPAA